MTGRDPRDLTLPGPHAIYCSSPHTPTPPLHRHGDRTHTTPFPYTPPTQDYTTLPTPYHTVLLYTFHYPPYTLQLFVPLTSPYHIVIVEPYGLKTYGFVIDIVEKALHNTFSAAT